MSDRRVLVTSTFPIQEARDGGRKRVRAIVDAYGRRFSDVVYAAVYESRHHPVAGPFDIALPPGLAAEALARPLTGDLIAGRAIAGDGTVRQHFLELFRRFRPDVIHVEHPFSWLGLRRLLAEEGLDPKVVYGSANVEAPLRAEILRACGAQESLVEEVEHEIAELEREFSRECDLLAACTESDLQFHRSVGAARTVLAPNGMDPMRPGPDERRVWRERLRAEEIERFALFVASPHVPNQVGVAEIIGGGLGFLGRHERIVFAGAIGGAIQERLAREGDSVEAATFWLRAMNAGSLPEPRLQALIAEADALLLPITSGGGSNLKTAEAILADTRVIATSTALRGFEWFADFPNVWIADTRTGFRQAVREAFDAPLEPRTVAQQELAASVTWERCLAPLVEAVAAL